jgi:hypothetical protein
MDSTRLRKLCSNGSFRNTVANTASLHLSYHTIHLTLHRKIVTAISAHHPGIDVLHAPGAFIKAREAAAESVEWLSQIRPEHLEGFWYNCAPPISYLTVASRNNFVLIGAFITLLQAVAFTSSDRDALRQIWERLKWRLRIFSRGNELFEGALRRVEDKRQWIEGVLEKGFTPNIPPRPKVREPTEPKSTPQASDSGPLAGLQSFPTQQSMEDLLSAELGAQGGHNNVHPFDDGFFGFEEFSGWFK